MPSLSTSELARLAGDIKAHGRALGFAEIGIAAIELAPHVARLDRWLAAERHGTMGYMARHRDLRAAPDKLLPGAVRAICARMNYWSAEASPAPHALSARDDGYVARYALGRDYHKVLRGRLKKLAQFIDSRVGEHGYRVTVDSAPVLEKALAEAAGLGWIGKHTNLINRHAGSWFVLGELLTDLPLPADTPAAGHCGSCRACLDVCPTQAIVAPYELDARRCVSYLTIELKGAIPQELRAAIGNRIFGCDDCQLVCPWNKFARPTHEPEFAPRHGLDRSQLIELFSWSESEWSDRTAGSAIRRAGYLGWLRNIAVALGNAARDETVIRALRARSSHASQLVREHVRWALDRHDAS